MLQKSGAGKVAAPSLPCEGVPYNYQAVGTFVGRGNPPPVFADAEAGDHVKVALQGRRESALKRQGCGRTEAPAGEAGAPDRTEPLSRLVWLEVRLPPASLVLPHSRWVANFLPLETSEGCATPPKEQQLPGGPGLCVTLNPGGE